MSAHTVGVRRRQTTSFGQEGRRCGSAGPAWPSGNLRDMRTIDAEHFHRS
ncbi:hypothetical protein DF3PB_1720003 [uncultured Defluviicoccus sp.]|uniref:Uncharacterized protein n=1 Tax=metagenome TaxID=256318 RepID=A0A380TA53_9ZZZZ|nr:hypothetical protein DF3PB_1720003 [uncultured Defluviicoccus sp.]